MTTPIYPAQLPGPTTFVLAPGSQVVGGGNEGGPIALRRRSRQPTAKAQVSFRFLENDYEVFVDFWKTSLLYGHRWFILPTPGAIGIAPQVVRFDTRYTASKQGFRYMDVSAALELRSRPLP
jgi:hypothetical protein